MALEPITRQEQIIAGKDLKPITRMEMFLKQYGGVSGGGADWNASEGEAGYVKNRTHYEEHISIIDEQTVTTAATDEPGVCVAFLELNGNDHTDSNTFSVVFNGDVYQYEDIVGDIILGNKGIVGNIDTGEPFFINVSADGGILVTPSATTATVAVRKEFMKQLDTKFLRDDVPKYGKVGEVTRIEWDGNTSDLDIFVDNGCAFYKVSDFTVPFLHIASLKAERSDGYVFYEFYEQPYGTMVNGYTAAIVTDAENNNIPSNGLYFRYDQSISMRCLRVEIDTHRDNTALYLSNPSGVKYAITIDDSGTLTATEVT